MHITEENGLTCVSSSHRLTKASLPATFPFYIDTGQQNRKSFRSHPVLDTNSPYGNVGQFSPSVLPHGCLAGISVHAFNSGGGPTFVDGVDKKSKYCSRVGLLEVKKSTGNVRTIFSYSTHDMSGLESSFPKRANKAMIER